MSMSGAVVAVQLDNDGQGICGGSQLSGRVYLSVEKESTTAQSLNIKFYGQESTCVQYSESVDDGDGKSHSETRYAYDKRPIVTIDCVLATFPGRVSRGNYEFPFVINIPYGLPGKQGSKSTGSYFVIEYFLEARLHRQGIIKVVNHREIFLTDSPYTGAPTPSMEEPVQRPVYFLCCLHQGNMTMLANVDNTNVCVGEPFRIDYAIKNESSSAIKALEISVTQSVRFSAAGHADLHVTKLFHRRLTQSEVEGTETSQRNGQEEQFLLTTQELRNRLREIELQNFPLARSTVRGQLGSVLHTVSVKICTKMCVQNPQVDIALQVHQSAANAAAMFKGIAPAVAIEFQKPIGWQAETAPVVVLQASVVPSAPMATAEIVGTSMATAVPVPSAPGVPGDLSTVPGLVQQLKTSGNQFTETSILKEWLTYGDFSPLTSDPRALSSVFQTIRGEYAYTAFPEALGKACGVVFTVQLVAAAARVVPEAQRGRVCTSFVPYVTNKEEARAAFSALALGEHALAMVLLSYGQ